MHFCFMAVKKVAKKTAAKKVKKAAQKKAAIAPKKPIKKPEVIRKSKAELTVLKLKAESMFLDTDLTQKEIANILSLSEITISNWANDGSPTWDELRKLKSVGRPQALAKLYTRLVEQVDAKENSDSIHKTLLVIKELEDKRTALPETINTMREFATFLMGENLVLAQTLIPFQTAFIGKKVNERKS